MRTTCRTVGLTVEVECADRTTSALLAESLAGLGTGGRAADPDLVLQVESGRGAFDVRGWEPLTRGAWRSGQAVVLEDACSSGYDVRVETGPVLLVQARRRRTARDLAQARLLPARHHLLVRAALLQYPALWWAGLSGRVPLHVSALCVQGTGVLLAGPGGTGKSTLVRAELAAGGSATCDNIAVSSGTDLFGLLEPVRAESGPGRRMPHGRREAPWAGRDDHLLPERALVLRRGQQDVPVLRPVPASDVARALAAGTYAAGELRRYWPFVATLALGTGLGPPHPPVHDVARLLAGRVRCEELVLPRQPGTTLRQVLDTAGVPA